MTITQLRNLVMNALDGGASDAIRASRGREAVEQAQDLADFVRFASGVIGGSRVLDMAAVKAADLLPLRSAAQERMQARQMLDQLRASQVTGDNPGIVPRPVDGGTATTGIGGGLPLIRQYALRRDMSQGGTAPVTPGVTAGDIDGEIVAEGTGDPSPAAVTIADVGAARSRLMAICFAQFSRQSRDWADPTVLAMLDQILYDIADRAAEKKIGADLIAAPGAGTRVAGADLTTLGTALDAAEAAAGAAMNTELATGSLPGLLIVNPANWPKVRRAIGTAWLADAPHPLPAVSIGVPAGTAVVLGPGGVHLFADDPIVDAAVAPSILGQRISVGRPFYLSVRAAAAVQLITAIPA